MVNSDGAPGNTDGDGTPIVTDLTIATLLIYLLQIRLLDKLKCLLL